MNRKRFLILTLPILLTAGLELIGYSQLTESSSTPVLSDATDSGNLEVAARIGEGGGAEVVAVQGDYAYLGLGYLLVVMDISMPVAPRRVGALWMPGYIWDIAVASDYVYVAAGEAGLRVVDVSDPAQPSEIGFYGPSAVWREATRVTVTGNTVYLVEADYSARLQILDVSNPAQPITLGSVVPGQGKAIRDISAAGSYVYLAVEYDDWLHTVAGSSRNMAVRNPQPHYPMPPEPPRSSALEIVDISYLENPVLVGHWDEGCVYKEIPRVTAIQGYVYFACDDLWVLDVSIPNRPTVKDFVQIPGRVLATAASESELYVYGDLDTTGDNTTVLDVLDPANPVEIGTYVGPGDARDLTVAKGYAYYAGRGSGLRVMDLSDLANPYEVARYDPPGIVSHVAVAGDYAYAVTVDGFWVVDVSDPTEPVQVSLNDILCLYAEAVEDLLVKGDYAYVLAGNALQVLDISDPIHPTQVGLYETTDAPTHDLVIAGDYAYLSTWNGLLVLDISNPANPTAVGFYASSYGFDQVVVSGDLALAVGGKRLSVLDVSNPISPVEVGFFEAEAWLQSVAVENHYAYVVDWYGRLQVLDISDQANPAQVGQYPVITGESFPAPVMDVAVDGDYLYIVDGGHLNRQGGLRAINISEPADPTDAGFYSSPVYPKDMDLSTTGIFVADGSGGLVVLRFSSSDTVTGQVSQSNGLPMDGVRIDMGAQFTTNTDAAGVYSFANVPQGIYTLEPSLTDYVFLPPTRTIALPPSMNYRSFVILPMPVAITLTSNVSETLVYTDTQGLVTRLGFPVGVVAQTTVLTLRPTVAAMTGLAFAGHAFELSAYQQGSAQLDFAFKLPVTVTIHYSDADVWTVSAERELRLWWWAESDWQDAAQACDPALPYNHDTKDKILNVSICTVGRFALFGPTNQVYLPRLSH